MLSYWTLAQKVGFRTAVIHFQQPSITSDSTMSDSTANMFSNQQRRGLALRSQYPFRTSHSAVSAVIWSLDLGKWAGLARMRGRLVPSNSARVLAAGLICGVFVCDTVNIRGSLPPVLSSYVPDFILQTHTYSHLFIIFRYGCTTQQRRKPYGRSHRGDRPGLC